MLTALFADLAIKAGLFNWTLFRKYAIWLDYLCLPSSSSEKRRPLHLVPAWVGLLAILFSQKSSKGKTKHQLKDHVVLTRYIVTNGASSEKN